MYLRRWTRVEKEGRNLKAEENALETLEQFVDGQRRGAKTEYGASLFATLLEVQGVVRKDWKGVIRTWEEMKGETGLNEKAVEMVSLFLLLFQSLGLFIREADFVSRDSPRKFSTSSPASKHLLSTKAEPSSPPSKLSPRCFLSSPRRTGQSTTRCSSRLRIFPPSSRASSSKLRRNTRTRRRSPWRIWRRGSSSLGRLEGRKGRRPRRGWRRLLGRRGSRRG
ncbi:hypothetical protein BDY24DRAFT_389381 [Mrakia frigida]|uniref:uncharacterized protein n=1 Tax=Mrakia frigida TaxID=29902 RepID=UPI003FCC170E